MIGWVLADRSLASPPFAARVDDAFYLSARFSWKPGEVPRRKNSIWCERGNSRGVSVIGFLLSEQVGTLMGGSVGGSRARLVARGNDWKLMGCLVLRPGLVLSHNVPR